MAKSASTKLDLTSRDAAHSRATRRLRRSGRVPGVLYGMDKDPLAFEVGERELRHALAGSGAVLELTLEGGSSTASAVVKDVQRHPVRGDLMHVDLLRVDLNVTIQAGVSITLVGGDDAPGVKEGGILSSPIPELTIEAKPADIPDTIEVDVSGLDVAGTLLLSELTAPAGVTFVDDPETVVATITAPTKVEVEDEVEAETEVVGEDKADDAGDEAEGDAEASDASTDDE